MTRTAPTAVGRRILGRWRLFSVVVIVALAGVSCSSTETVIRAETSTTPTAVPADQQPQPTLEPTTEVPTVEAPTAVPEPTVAAPTATPVPQVASPVQLVDGETGRGTISDASEPVLFEFAAQAGDAFNLTVEPLDPTHDVVVDVVDSDQQSIIGGELDDSFGVESIRGVGIEESGVFTVVVSSFGDTVGDVSVLVEFVDLPEGELVGFGQVTVIEVTADDIVGQTTFAADAGEWVDITVVPLDELDVVVDVRDSNGASLLPNGPVDSSFDTERIRVLEMPFDGIYSVVVSGFLGTSGSAEVTVDLSLKDFGSLLQGSDVIDDPQEPQEFPFNALAGDVVRLVVDPVDADHDVVLSIIEVATDEVLDEVDASTGIEELTIEVPRDGDYYFQVWSFEDSVGSFDFILLAPETTVLVLAPGDAVTGRIGRAPSLQYTYQPRTAGTLTIGVGPLDDTELTLSLYDRALDQIVDAEQVSDGGQVLTYDVTADVVYLFEVASASGGGSFELGLTLE